MSYLVLKSYHSGVLDVSSVLGGSGSKWVESFPGTAGMRDF
jgi:hypothetical protein